MGSVIRGEFDLLTDSTVRKIILWKLKDIPYRGTPEPIKSLIIIANDTEIEVRVGEFEQDTFLDGIGVLILVDHQKLDLIERISLSISGCPSSRRNASNLDGGEIEIILFFQDAV